MSNDDVITYQEISNEMQMPLAAKNLIQRMEDEWNNSHRVNDNCGKSISVKNDIERRIL